MSKVAEILFMMMLGIVGGVVLAEWAVGCGQSYEDASGNIHIGKCIILR